MIRILLLFLIKVIYSVILTGIAEAIPVYHEYLENEPESFEAMTYLAECYEKMQ